MLPVLLDLRFIKIYTFGVFLVLAFFWSSFLLWSNIRLSSYKEEDVFDGVFLSLAGGLFFGRLVYVILHFDKFGFNIAKFILINGYPGLSLYGCIAGGLFVYYIYSLFNKIHFFELFDYLASPLFLGIAIGKLGSFFGGVEVGTKTPFLLSIKYVGYDGLRHLTAFYESIIFFVCTLLAYRMFFDIRRGKYGKGFTFFFFWSCLAALQYLFGMIKVTQGSMFHYNIYMYISLAILLTTTLYFLYYFRSRLFRRIGLTRIFSGFTRIRKKK